MPRQSFASKRILQISTHSIRKTSGWRIIRTAAAWGKSRWRCSMQAILSADQNWGIGKDGGLLVRVSEDMKFFRETTRGHAVVMGRKTFESLPGALAWAAQYRAFTRRLLCSGGRGCRGSSGAVCPAGGAEGGGVRHRRRGDLPAAAALYRPDFCYQMG